LDRPSKAINKGIRDIKASGNNLKGRKEKVNKAKEKNINFSFFI